MASLNLRPIDPSSSSSRKSKAKAKAIPSASTLKPWDFSYSPSADGYDKNLLIMFHGLGDSKIPFFNLAKQLNLPSTAVLSLSAPDPIPLMDHPSFSWYPTFTPTYDPLPVENHNPTTHLPKLRALITKLISPEVGWELNQIHLFGFAQGGTMVLELGLSVGKDPLSPAISSSSSSSSGESTGSRSKGKAGDGKGDSRKVGRFGSITSICGPILTHPTTNLNIQTPICYFTRYTLTSSVYKKQITILKRAFKEVIELHAPSSSSGGVERMPGNKEEWWGIMRFWGQILNRKSDDEGWKGSGEVYEVIR
ncbi:uncharacterized protein I303_106094 [Kwoniella dejecticola CBS 10117]|uniref:Phospholipase/carboxylesterase/thioesterase domain-containing protein n=1 Tax=Kwoniella dejecticola CBS 10117 TaxID=1296121 RepID=A0A1A6A1A0_9TREE|nr:uncharacterized protein I303_06113 [Kwoniella dejecticola CBS 10117]OBR83830.1 hypothetical protein I303_06113 [Kwoniella dejecticola CBS 10117]